MRNAVGGFGLLMVLLVAVGAGCAAADASPRAPATAGLPACPTDPVAAVAVEDFYGNMLSQLGGSCVNVTSILSDPNADPHEYQPTANDARAYQGAQLVVENGLGYDDFSDKIIATLSRKPLVLDVGAAMGLKVGDNPHVWYSPEHLYRIAWAMHDGLKQVNPSAGAYFDSRIDAFFDSGLTGYRASLTEIQTRFKGTPIGSTESIFAYMARATGLDLVSPQGLMDAVAEGNEPAARDLATFQNQITQHRIRVLVYNSQTVTNLTEQLKAIATANNVPLVAVSETMPPGAQSIQDWQSDQLQQLIKALSQSG